MSTARKVSYLRLGEVLERGWTRPLVARHLGEPDTTKRGRNNTVKLFELSRVQRAEKCKAFARDKLEIENQRIALAAVVPKHCDLLLAIFAVNRAAKRWRDAASSHYDGGRFAWATSAKEHKNYLYALKDRGIAAAFAQGRIAPVDLHGRLCLYCGEGYCFHSRLVPSELEIATTDESPILIEAKPQSSRESKQRDAIAHLEALPRIDPSAFDVLASPGFERTEVECWRCGELGHVSRDCPDFEDDEDL
jgi:hypothetical protein